MRRVLAFVSLCLFGFLGCTVNSQGTGVGGSTGGAAGVDGGGGGGGSSGNGGGCFPGPGQKFCGNNCQSTSDPQYGCASPNCTACTATHGTATCDNGKCGITCDQNYADCDHNSANGCEIDTQTNPYNCGGCAAAGGKNCFLDTTASNWECVNGVCEPSKCNFGKADCQGTGTCETDLTADVNNCGSCGHVCNLSNATPACQPVSNPQPGTPPGQCVIGKCNPGYADCNGKATDGCETNISTGDPNNCGACGNTCDATNGVASCLNGSCTIACKSGFGDCNSSPGCETNLTNTTDHCGACGTGCTNAHGTTSCSGSKCQPVCDNGYGDCDSNPNNGCESRLDTLAHCGSCGKACPNAPANATETCSAGTCGFTCNAGYHQCGGSCYPDNDPNHCGSSCTSCPGTANGTAVCSSGSCSIQCNPTFHECSDGKCYGNTDPSHCGSSCTSCPNGGGTAVCSGGSCSVQCASGSHLCSGTCYSDTDPHHCGSNGSCSDCGPNVCYSDACCTKNTCSANSCGTMSDGCGGTVNCGNCSGAGVCNNNTCCTPNTCSANYSGQCGTFSNGCGATISCTCGAGHSCISGACCGDVGQSCSSGSECCTGNCGTSGASNNQCCRSDGSSCNTDADCCSNHCHNDGLCHLT